MNTENKHAPRLLGAAFLLVIATSLLGGTLSSAVGTGSISDILTHIANNLGAVRLAIFGDLLNSLAIMVLASLLYIVLKKYNKIAALIALGWWLGEALFCAISKIGAFALIPLSLDFVQAGAPPDSFYQGLAQFLYYGVAKQAYTLHMFFYCAGGLLWYTLFYRAKAIPRIIPVYGLIAVVVAFIGNVFQLFGYEVPIYVFIPILPFELGIGFWLLLKGMQEKQA